MAATDPLQAAIVISVFYLTGIFAFIAFKLLDEDHERMAALFFLMSVAFVPVSFWIAGLLAESAALGISEFLFITAQATFYGILIPVIFFYFIRILKMSMEMIQRKKEGGRIWKDF